MTESLFGSMRERKTHKPSISFAQANIKAHGMDTLSPSPPTPPTAETNVSGRFNSWIQCIFKQPQRQIANERAMAATLLAKKIFKNSTLRERQTTNALTDMHVVGARPLLDMALRIAVICQLSHGNGLSKGPILQLKYLHGAGAKLSARPLHHSPCQRLALHSCGDEPDNCLKPLFALDGVAEEDGRVFPLIRSYRCTGREVGWQGERKPISVHVCVPEWSDTFLLCSLDILFCEKNPFQQQCVFTVLPVKFQGLTIVHHVFFAHAKTHTSGNGTDSK